MIDAETKCFLETLTPETIRKLDKKELKWLSDQLTPRTNKYIKETPTAKQTAFLLLNHVREVMYGGAAGGGKSIALLMAALQYVDVPGYSALLLRKTFTDLAQPSALLDLANDWLGGTDARYQSFRRTWMFPSGATLSFGYLETEKDKYRYAGAQYQFIGFDELTQFEESQYRFLFSRLRNPTKLDVPLRMRSASNPGGVGHEWVRQRFINESEKGRAFVPAKLNDNPHISREYISSLNQLDPITRAQLLSGDWGVRPSGGLFYRHWFEFVESYPHDAIQVRYWDLASTIDGDWTVGLKLAEKDGIYYVCDVQRMRGTPLQVQNLVRNTANMDGRKVQIYMEQEPGSSGVNTIDQYAREVLKGYTFRANRVTGDKIQRAMPVSSAAEHKNIKIVHGRYITDFIDELEAFPETAHDDQVDALSGAFQAIIDINASRIRQIGKIDWKPV